MKNNQISAGSRIRLLSMPDDPDPIEPGTTGVVTDIREVGFGQDRWLHIDVDWEDRRKLMLASPPDRFEVITTTLSD